MTISRTPQSLIDSGAATIGQVLTADGAGNATFQDAGGGAWDLLGSYEVTVAQATVQFGSGLDVDGAIDSTYDMYALMGVSIVPVIDGTDPYIRMSDDLAVSFQAAYEFCRYGMQSTGTGFTFANSNGASQIDMCVFGFGNLANQEGGNFIAFLADPSNPNIYTQISGECFMNTDSSQMSINRFTGQNDESLAINALEFRFATGDIDVGAKFYLYGIKKS